MDSKRNLPPRNLISSKAAPLGVTHSAQHPSQVADVRAAPVLNSWKEIANYLGRGVRTVQRYEAQLGLPVRRAAGKARSSVMAFSDEIDKWLNQAAMKSSREVRRVLLVLDAPVDGALSQRKIVLEIARFNVLTAYNAEEVFEIANRVDIDGVVVECRPGDAMASEICECLKERHPKKLVFAISTQAKDHEHIVEGVDYIVDGSDPAELLDAVVAAFGVPNAE